MQCFCHPTIQAVGMCRYCKKGLCLECAHFEKECLCCKTDICQKNVSEELEIIERSKKTYFIGDYSSHKLNFYFAYLLGPGVFCTLISLFMFSSEKETGVITPLILLAVGLIFLILSIKSIKNKINPWYIRKQ